jgi:two-component system chemotaxis response regulator CheY
MSLDVLIVDDSPAMRKFVERVLHLSGLPLGVCRTAADGAEALTLLREAPADIVLTDINMPGMDGEELVRQVAADEALSQIPILVVSTDHTRQRMDRLFALGARGYVAKPFYPEGLREEIERVLASGKS